MQINLVNGCVSAALVHATFDHVYLDSRVGRLTTHAQDAEIHVDAALVQLAGEVPVLRGLDPGLPEHAGAVHPSHRDVGQAGYFRGCWKKSINWRRIQLKYSVDRMDVALDMDQWGEWAALARAASSALISISDATSTLSTLYSGRSFSLCSP